MDSITPGKSINRHTILNDESEGDLSQHVESLMMKASKPKTGRNLSVGPRLKFPGLRPPQPEDFSLKRIE
jgi:hypothetical protein